MAEPVTPRAPQAGGGRWRRLALGVVVLLVATAAGLALWGRGRLRASLPQLDGEVAVEGLSAPVRITRDSLGVPTVYAEDRLDLTRGLGFLHAQERFFQMDLMRRQAAGELAELFGKAALPADRAHRLHRFRARAERLAETADPVTKRLLQAYAEGVRAGLWALEAPPFEYLVLGAEPAPWRPADTLLAVYAMYFQLHDEDGSRESAWGLIHDLLGPEWLDFLAPWGTSWDAPIDGTPLSDPPLPASLPVAAPLPLPPVPALPAPAAPGPRPGGPEPGESAVTGSNNWAVAGAHTAHGGAMLANDMHLGLGVPNIWYRASLVYPDPGDPAGERRITGVTLPGGPLVIVGSNGRVAWGFTNTYGDWIDLVVLESPDGEAGGAYLTPDGPRLPERHREVLRVRGAEDEVLEVEETPWGPIVDRDHQGRRRAVRWIAHDAAAVNLELVGLEGAGDVDEAMAVANRVGAPPQNFVVADAGGRIGWTVMGPMPRRFGHDGRLPLAWADGGRGWDGYLAPAEYPRLADPPGGRIWTANSRVVGGEMLARLGHGGYVLGARARQIRDRLLELESATEGDLLAVQLDDRALFLERWRGLLLEVLSPEATAGHDGRAELRRLVEDWGGRAAVDSAGYRLVRAFRLELLDRVLGELTAPCRQADERFRLAELHQVESALWRLANEQPAELLPSEPSWEERLLAAVDGVLDYFAERGGRLADRTWGERNTARIRHPLSRFLPGSGRLLDMPAEPLPGDSYMPRVQAPAEGASQRLVVAPGREEEGLFHMPAGQSGHPLSPHYRAGHRAWAAGEPAPFLPGTVAHTLVLRPDA